MKIYKTSEVLTSPTAVALGFFDGIHKGHQAVIGAAAEYAQQHRITPLVFTFSENPKTVLCKEKPETLFTDEDRLLKLADNGIEELYLENFENIRNMAAESFVKDFLKNTLKAEFVSCGFNYRFGAGGFGTVEKLIEWCSQYKIEVKHCEPVLYDDLPISSTRIRMALATGKLTEANDMLGHRYGFSGSVIHGNEIGRTLGTPTLNQAFPKKMCVPTLGVYATTVSFGGESYCGVTNIGFKPTVGSDILLAETWMPDYHGSDLYDEIVDIRLVEFIRPERKFDSLEELRQEIYRNAEAAKKIISPYLHTGL